MKVLPLKATINGQLEIVLYLVWCDACNSNHPYYIKHYPDRPEGDLWKFINNDLDHPTFRESILIKRNEGKSDFFCCHSYVTNGMMEYQLDCTHEFKGRSVPLADRYQD